MHYYILFWRCSSHKVNLVNIVAIIGKLVAEPVDQDDLCRVCSQLYKHVMPSYIAEFTSALRQYIVRSVVLVHSSEESLSKASRHQLFAKKMVALYGEEVLSPGLMTLYNLTFEEPQTLCASGSDVRQVRSDFLTCCTAIFCV
eukprot:3171391-Karenia_brevis.AAC.1